MKKKNTKPKEKKYIEFGKWLKSNRGSNSLESFSKKIGLSPSFIYEVESGYKRPSASKVGFLAAILEGDPDELAGMANRDCEKVRFAYKSTRGIQTDMDVFLEQAMLQIANASAIRDAGHPLIAKNQLDYWIELLDHLIDSDLDTPVYQQRSKFILIKSLIERMACNTEILPRHQILNPLFNDYSRVAKKCMDLEDGFWLAQASSWLAGGYHVAHDFIKARKLAEESLALFESHPRILSETFRGLLLDHSYLEDEQGYQAAEIKILDEIQKGKFNEPVDLAAIFEGISFGKFIFKKPDAERTFETTEKYVKISRHSKSYKALRELQMRRTRMHTYLMYKHENIRLDKNIVRKKFQKAHSLAKSLPDYARHLHEIEFYSRGLGIEISEEKVIPRQFSFNYFKDD